MGKDLVAAMKGKKSLTMTIIRPKIRTIALTREADLGAEFDVSEKSEFMCLSRVYGGVIKEWNFKNPRERVVKGDRLFEVNGCRDPKEMESILSGSVKTLNIKLYCYS